MDEIIKKLAVELNIDDLELLEKVVRSQFKFVKDVIESGEQESVHLTYFGKFAIKPNRLKYLPENFEDNIHKSGKEILNNPVD